MLRLGTLFAIYGCDDCFFNFFGGFEMSGLFMFSPMIVLVLAGRVKTKFDRVLVCFVVGELFFIGSVAF